MNSPTDHDMIEKLIVLLEHLGREEDYPDTEESELDQVLARCMKRFVDRMPGGFFAYRADEKEEIIYANQAMVRLLGCETLEEFRAQTGNSFRGLVHPQDLESVENSIREQIAHSSFDLDYVEYRIITREGQIRWIDDYGHFIHGKTVGDVFYVFAGDATEKKNRLREEQEFFLEEKRRREGVLQAKLKEYDQQLEKDRQEQLRRLEVIEGLSVDYESIFYINLEQDSVKAYRLSSRFKAQFPEEAPVRVFTGFDSRYIREWVYPEDRGLLEGVSTREFLQQKLAGDRTFYVNYRVLKDGNPTYMQLRIVDVGNEDTISQVVFGYRNIDKEVRRDMEQRQLLMEALREAKLANDAKSRFLSNMSHDIRTPMNAIMGFTALARKNSEDRERLAEYLDMISVSGEQLLQLLNDVLEISRIESVQMEVAEAECSLTGLLQQIQNGVFFRAAAKKITLIMDSSGLRHNIVRADGEKLGRILSYLVDNALKYTPENGRVTISVIEQETLQDKRIAYQFVVEDDGMGISAEFLEHIFDPFEREKNTTFSGIYGTGLGLTITKKLVDRLGGNISVTSVPGKGSRFAVWLPLRAVEGCGENGSEEAGGAGTFADSKRILLVDDNDINLEIEAEMLKDAGFLVETVRDGKAAFETIRQARAGEYDLILMDIQMPVMDGYHAARAIRGIQDPELAGIPIIAVSANAFEEDRRKALESGMNAHLPKPLDMAQLFEIMGKFL